MFIVKKQDATKPIGTRSDIGIKNINKERNKGRDMKRIRNRFGAVCA